jgi:long-subunit fatty acid transport protein
MRIFPAAAIAVAIMALAPSAWADPFSTTGYDTESAMLANSNTAFGSSLGVLYTNPALLTDVKNTVGVNFIFNMPMMSVKLRNTPPGSTVPISIYDSTAGVLKKSDDIALPTVELLHQRSNTNTDNFDPWATIGVAYNFGVKRLQIAILASLPISQYAAQLTTHYNDEREANFTNKLSFTRFGQWDKVGGVMVGAAYQPLDWFSFGLTLQVTIATTTNLNLYVPDANVQNYSQSNLDMKLAVGVRPMVGVRFQPLKWLGIGLAWRNESTMPVDGAGTLLLWNYHETDTTKTIPKRTTQPVKLALGFEPMEATLGIGVNFQPFTTQVSVTWQRWSHYIDNHATMPQNYIDPAVIPLPAGYSDYDSYKDTFRFHDTFNVNWSGQYQFAKWGQVAIGFTYQPTPVPAQIGRTNYVDNDLIGVTAGAKFDVEFQNKTSLTLGIDVQFWQMFSRTTWKDPKQIIDEFPDDSKTALTGAPMAEATGLQTNNPGYPGYRSGGTMVSTGVSISYNF